MLVEFIISVEEGLSRKDREWRNIEKPYVYIMNPRGNAKREGMPVMRDIVKNVINIPQELRYITLIKKRRSWIISE